MSIKNNKNGVRVFKNGYNVYNSLLKQDKNTMSRAAIIELCDDNKWIASGFTMVRLEYTRTLIKQISLNLKVGQIVEFMSVYKGRVTQKEFFLIVGIEEDKIYTEEFASFYEAAETLEKETGHGALRYAERMEEAKKELGSHEWILFKI